jgi:peptidoglycan/xylan/chitin deacetylase (PgdA/CDA1 family)
MANGIICLTFDFDAVSNWINAGLTTPAPISRGEFGAVAVERILHMLGSRDIRSTWSIPGHTIETYPEQCRAVVTAGHEVGLHGYLHEHVGKLTETEERAVFRRAYDLVGNLTGEAPRGSRTPAWDFSPHTIDIMLELGLQYDSSLMGNDYAPLYCRRGDVFHPDGRVEFGKLTDLVELPVSWSLDDFPHFEFLTTPTGVFPGLRASADVYANFTDDIVYMERDFDQGVAVITFHPQVSGRGHRLLALERWIDQLTEMGLRFDRCDTVAKQVKEGRKFGTYQPR